MAATRNIQSSVLFALPFLGYQPANISNQEPAMTAANMVKQTMMGAPFKWPWNRKKFTILVDLEEQDYLLEVLDYGYLEQAWITDPDDATIKEIPVKKSLSAESAVQRPQSIAVQMQDDDGIMLRLNTIPDKLYDLSGFYQAAPPPITSLASTWAPIPDNLGYVFDWGFLAMLSMLTKDIRTPIFQQRFVSHLLGVQDGLTALERNLFLGDWITVATTQERAQLSTQQGVQARGNG